MNVKDNALKANVIKNQQELAMRNFKFNRFLLLRYSLALFFFVNLYWLIFNLFTRPITATIPLLIIICSFLAVGEQIKLYWHHDNTLKFTKLFFKVQFFVNIFFAVVAWNESFFSFLYPFLTYGTHILILLYALFSAGALASFLLLKKSERISQNKDKKFELLKRYEKTLIRESDKHVRTK